MLIDILTGVLSDGPSGLSIRKYQDNAVEANKVCIHCTEHQHFYCLNMHAATWTP